MLLDWVLQAEVVGEDPFVTAGQPKAVLLKAPAVAESKFWQSHGTELTTIWASRMALDWVGILAQVELEDPSVTADQPDTASFLEVLTEA